MVLSDSASTAAHIQNQALADAGSVKCSVPARPARPGPAGPTFAPCDAVHIAVKITSWRSTPGGPWPASGPARPGPARSGPARRDPTFTRGDPRHVVRRISSSPFTPGGPGGLIRWRRAGGRSAQSSGPRRLPRPRPLSTHTHSSDRWSAIAGSAVKSGVAYAARSIVREGSWLHYTCNSANPSLPPGSDPWP